MIDGVDGEGGKFEEQPHLHLTRIFLPRRSLRTTSIMAFVSCGAVGAHNLHSLSNERGCDSCSALMPHRLAVLCMHAGSLNWGGLVLQYKQYLNNGTGLA